MSHENITFNDIFSQETFLNSLPLIPHVVTGSEIPFPSSIPFLYNGYNILPSQIPYTFLTQELGTLSQGPISASSSITIKLSDYTLPLTAGPTGPTKSFSTTNTYADFESAMYTAMGVAVDNKLYNGLLKDFTTALGIQIDSNNQVIGGDWSIITPAVSFAKTDGNNPFIKAFEHFLQTYPYPQKLSNLSGDVYYYYKTFINNYHNFLSSIALVQRPTQAYLGTGATNVFSDLASYEFIYKAYAKDTSDAKFQERFNQFYQDQIAEKGYFMPSQVLGEWVAAIRNEAGLNINLELIGSSLAENNSYKALILNRIIRLLIGLVRTLQEVGIAQAERLTYLTKYQNVYTALQTQIPVFLRDGKAPIGTATGPGSTDAGSARNELNSSFNGILTDNLRSLRGIQEDNAKKLQSNVNQTNDAVNQQTDMASTFIQQLSTLLSTILR